MNWFISRNNACIKRGRSIEWSLVDAKAVLLNNEDGMLLKLDDSGTAVWLAIDGNKTASDLARHICDLYDVGEDAARKDVLKLLRSLRSSDAIEYDHKGGKR